MLRPLPALAAAAMPLTASVPVLLQAVANGRHGHRRGTVFPVPGGF